AVGSGKARIEFNPQSFGFPAEPETQNVQGERLAVLQPSARFCAGALSHPGVGRALRDDPEKSIAYLRKQMNVLVTVDEIRRATEHIDKGAQLGRDLGNEYWRLEAACNGRPQDVVE